MSSTRKNGWSRRSTWECSVGSSSNRTIAIKNMAKSKIGALKRAEAILLDQQGEDEDQLILFSMDPDLDPEVQKIIDEPEI